MTKLSAVTDAIKLMQSAGIDVLSIDVSPRDKIEFQRSLMGRGSVMVKKNDVILYSWNIRIGGVEIK